MEFQDRLFLRLSKRSAAFVVVGALATSMFASAGPAQAKTMSGGNGADTIAGTAGADVIRARGGNDRITGGAGSDRLLGGRGARRRDQRPRRQ